MKFHIHIEKGGKKVAHYTLDPEEGDKVRIWLDLGELMDMKELQQEALSRMEKLKK